MTLFGSMQNGQDVHQLNLSNDDMSVKLLTLGICLQDVRLKGVDHSLTIGFDSLAPYEGDLFHVGTLMGPVANRIRGAQALIDGALHQFDRNFLDAHTLHGGGAATHAKDWDVTEHSETSATLTTALPDGEAGFPGNRSLTAHFELDRAALTLTLTATTDKPTILNLANHSYWNLGPEPTTRGHTLAVKADHYTPNDETLMPTGDVSPVNGTRFDYRKGRAIKAGDEGLIDVNLCLSNTRQPLRRVATLTGPTGLTMEMSTTEPGLQLFDGHILDIADHNDLDGTIPQAYAAFALEAQAWPDATNNPHFPDITLRPGETYRQITRWAFSKNT